MTFVCYNPGQKSLGQYCNIHIILSFLGSLLKQCILLEIFMQFSLPPPYTKLKLGKKFWIHLSNIVCGVRGGVGPEWSGKCPRNAKVCQDFCPWLYVCTLRICHTVVVNIFKNCNFNTKSVVYFLYYGCVSVSFLSRGNGACWNIGGLIFHSAMPVPLQLHFPKIPWCFKLAQANLFPIFAVSSVPVITLWQCISRQLFKLIQAYSGVS